MIYIIRSLSGSKQGYSVTWQAFFYTFVLDGLDGDVWPNWSSHINVIQVVGFPISPVFLIQSRLRGLSNVLFYNTLYSKQNIGEASYEALYEALNE